MADESPTGRGLMDVLGVDVGMKNLALCRLQQVNGKTMVVWWQMIDLLQGEKATAPNACVTIPSRLNPHLADFGTVNCVAIEQQPQFNTPMQNVAHGLMTYFKTVCPDAQVYMSAATKKLKPFDAETETYDDRKKSAETIVAELLTDWIKSGHQVERHTQFAKWFTSLPKRDDAADALLHAYVALEDLTKPLKKPKKTVATLCVEQLKDELRARGLKVSGTKPELRKRLKAAKSAEEGRSGKSVTELRSELSALGLDSTGSKSELVKRLYEASKKRSKRLKL